MEMRSLSLIFFAYLSIISTIVSTQKAKDDMGTVIGIDLGTTYSWWVKLLSDDVKSFHYFQFL